MLELEGVEVTRQIRGSVPNTKVLVLTMHESDQMVRRELEAGARGYLLKSDLIACLLKAVKSVSTGQRFLTPKISKIVVERFLRTRSQGRHDEHADGD
jgi:DNA-binding NarL/FixJ family response regulator